MYCEIAIASLSPEIIGAIFNWRFFSVDICIAIFVSKSYYKIVLFNVICNLLGLVECVLPRQDSTFIVGRAAFDNNSTCTHTHNTHATVLDGTASTLVSIFLE